MKTKQVFKNAKWIIVCKIIQSVIQLVIGMISARYLGPSNYGVIGYTASYVSFFSVICQLGFTTTAVKEIMDNEERQGEILGTTIFFRIGNVNTFPAIKEQIPIPSAVFSATARCTAWAKTAAAASGIRKTESRTAPPAYAPTVGKITRPSVRK